MSPRHCCDNLIRWAMDHGGDRGRLIRAHSELIREHLLWLDDLSLAARDAWEAELRHSAEDALAQAWTRRLLLPRVRRLEPGNLDLDGGPHFTAHLSRHERFHVACICLTLAQVEQVMQLAQEISHHPDAVAPLLVDRTVVGICREQSQRAAHWPDAPTLLLVAAVAPHRALAHFGRPQAQTLLSDELPQIDDDYDDEITRPLANIAGLLLCGFAALQGDFHFDFVPESISGVINPAAATAFPRRYLRDIPFCQRPPQGRGAAQWI